MYSKFLSFLNKEIKDSKEPKELITVQKFRFNLKYVMSVVCWGKNKKLPFQFKLER